jgi:hypothetical protein
MANNRMSLKCVCGAERYLAKRYGDGYYVSTSPDEYVSKMDEWLDEHAFCGNMDHFTISYEIKPNTQPSPSTPAAPQSRKDSD